MLAAALLALLWPVHGDVVRPFSLGPDPFARGAHRGIDIAARRGGAVRAACAGRVTFAGGVPRSGRVVAQRCGGWAVTYVELAGVSVRRGRRLRAGERLGTSGRVVHLGVRRAADRFGYVDPLALLPPVRGPVVGPAPVVLPARRRVFPPPVRAAPGRMAPPGLPVAVWAGVGLLGLAVPTLVLVRGRRRWRRRPGTASMTGSVPAGRRTRRGRFGAP